MPMWALFLALFVACETSRQSTAPVRTPNIEIRARSEGIVAETTNLHMVIDCGALEQQEIGTVHKNRRAACITQAARIAYQIRLCDDLALRRDSSADEQHRCTSQ